MHGREMSNSPSSSTDCFEIQKGISVEGNLQSSHRPRLCFVSLDNFAALVGDPKYGNIGGAEMQQAIIGRNLAKHGYRVSFITLDHGQHDEMVIDGMRIIKAYAQDAGIRMLRFAHPRLTSLWRAMRRANADIYYQRTRDSITGIVAAFCRRYRRKFVFAVAHDTDCMTDPPHCPTRHERALYHYGLRRADLVIAQTVTQQKLLRENFGIDSVFMPNCAPDYGRCPVLADTVPSTREKRLLWVGQFRPSKRLELLLDVAEQHQDLQFDVIGDSNNESEYVKRLRLRAKSLPNVHLHGIIPHARVQQYYQRSAALICTSRAEGFPNIYLEAWSHGLPVVTTFDPDEVVSRQGLGKVGKDISQLSIGIRELLDSSDRWQKVSRSAREYYMRNHTEEKVIERLERVLLEIVEPS